MANAVEKAVLAAGCLVKGNFVFASGVKATKKMDMEKLAEHPEKLAVVLEHIASHPAMIGADVIMAVPDGAQRLFSKRMGDALDLPVVYLKKKPGNNRYAFEFASPADEKLALAAKHPRIIEDTVTTLGSVAGVAKLLKPKTQDIQAIVVWRRGVVDPKYRLGLKDHYLVEKHIPLH